jgi:S-layer homology domain.
MRKRGKKVFAIILSALLCTAGAAFLQEQNSVYSMGAASFTDVTSNYWGYSYIDFSANHGVINGYLSPNGTYQFLPEKSVTREEAVCMLYRSLSAAGKLESQEDFSAEYADMLTANKIAPWADRYISYGLKYKIITEGELADFTDDNGYGIAAPRDQVAFWTAKAINKKLMPAYSLIYTDKDSISADKVPYIDLLYRQGIMQGDDTKMFHPASGIKRAEFAAISNRVYSLVMSDTYQIQKETQSYRGTIVSVDSVNNRIMMTQSDGTARMIQVNPKTQIVIDGKLNYNGLKGISTGSNVIVAWGAFYSTDNNSGTDSVMQLHIVTKTQSKAGLISKIDKIDSSTSLLQIENSDGDIIYYILDKNSQTSVTPKKGQEIHFISDGVKILELQ